MAASASRSILLIPAHGEQQVREASQWRPDAICLDLGDLVPANQRAAAREALSNALSILEGQGVKALVRVSVDQRIEDMEAAVWPGLGGLVVPGLQTAREMWELDAGLAALEAARGLAEGTIGLMAYLDDGHGIWYARELAGASRRVEALVLGVGDLAFDMLKEPETVPFFTGPVPRFPVPEYIWGRLALMAADARVALIGLLGTTIAPGHVDKDKLLAAAKLAQQAGFQGAFTLHREGVEACKSAFGVPMPA